MELVYSEVESRRFGLRIVRATLEDADPGSLREAIAAARADVAICRLPAAMLPRLARLDEMGMPLVVADTLVHYYRDLSSPPPGPVRNRDLEYVEIGCHDADEVRLLVERTFPGYATHYGANPVLDGSDILEGYVEWAVGYLGVVPGRRVWVARRAGKPVALATCRYERDEVEGVLYGVIPEESGRGLYRDLIRLTVGDAAERGFARMHVSTQVHNFAVQKVWAAEGFVMRSAQVTFHVNAFLDSSFPEAVVVDRVAGDGPTWLDREARRCFSKVFAGRFEGVARWRHSAPAPLGAGARCRVRVSFPVTRRAGPLAVVQALDEAGALCHIAYYDLVMESGMPDAR